jgi:hypothetical protein
MSGSKPPKVSKKVSKPLTIARRVELLLQEGVDHPEKWASVHGYEEPQAMLEADTCSECTWQGEWHRLRKHHLEETEFLFDIIRELCEQVKTLDDQLDAQFENDCGING